MKTKFLIIFLGLSLIPFLSFSQKILPFLNNCPYNHAASITVLPSNSKLPNGDSLISSRIIVSAFGGSEEGKKDNIVWTTYSDDEGVSWTVPQNQTADSMFLNGDTLARDPLVFKLENNTVILLFRVQNREGSGSNGGPCFAYYKKSINGGVDFSEAISLEVPENLDSTFRNFTSLSKPVLKGDSLYFPFYYRNLGNRKAFYAVLITDKNFQFKRIHRSNDILGGLFDFSFIEPVGYLSKNKIVVYFRNSSGLVYSTTSEDGLVWTNLTPTSYANCDTKFEVTKLGNNEFKIFNTTTTNLNRDNLIASLLGTDTSYYLIDKFKDSLTIQYSYPSFEIVNGKVFCVYSEAKRTSIVNVRDSKIKFLKFDLSSVSQNKKFGSSFQYYLPNNSALIGFDFNSTHNLLLNKYGCLAKFNFGFDSLVSQIKLDTLFNTVRTISCTDSFIYFGGNFSNFSYGKYNLSSGIVNKFLLTRSIIEMKKSSRKLVFLSIDRNEFFINDIGRDTGWVSLPLQGKIVTKFNPNTDSTIICLFQDNSISEINLYSLNQKNLLGKSYDKRTIQLIFESGLLYSQSDSLMLFDLYSLESGFLEEISSLTNGYFLNYVQGKNKEVFFTTTNQVYAFDKFNKKIKLLADFAATQEIVGARLSSDSNILFIVGHNGLISKISLTDIEKIDVATASSFLFYPNPFTTILNLGYEGSEIYYELFNCSGLQIKSGNFTKGDNTLDLGNLSIGLYLFKLYDKNKNYLTTRRVLKI